MAPLCLVERATRIFAAISWGRIAAYFGKSLLIGLILLVPMAVTALIFFSLVGNMLDISNMDSFMFASLLVLIPVATLLMRLSTALPGIALGEPTTIRDAWVATRGETMTCFGLVLIFTALGFVDGFLQQLMVSRSFLLSFIWQFASGWFFLMVGLSVMTTLYGHYIQRRPLV